MRVVIDTNVLVSALFSRRGAANHIVSAAADGADGALVVLASPPCSSGHEEVLKRPEHRLRHGLDLGQVDTLLRSLATLVEPVDVQFLWRPQLRDPDDEMVLEAAINGSAISRTARPAPNFIRKFSRARCMGILTAGIRPPVTTCEGGMLGLPRGRDTQVKRCAKAQ